MDKEKTDRGNDPESGSYSLQGTGDEDSPEFSVGLMETLDAHLYSQTDIKTDFIPEQPDQEVEIFSWAPPAIDTKGNKDDDTHPNEVGNSLPPGILGDGCNDPGEEDKDPERYRP